MSSRSVVPLLALAIAVPACHPSKVAEEPHRADSVQGGPNRVYSVAALLQEERIPARVDIDGVCLRIDAKVAVGPPPITRSDWQLRDTADTTKAIWVTGPRPPDCGYESGSASSVRLQASVQTDSVRTIDQRVTRRRFLTVR
jgi:hypothetical protein